MAEGLVDGWPIGENGKPMRKISVSAANKIGLPEYSNVDVGPIYASRFVEDDGNVEDALREDIKLVEKIMGEERQFILDNVKKQMTASK